MQIQEKVLERMNYETETSDGEVLALIDEEVIAEASKRTLTLTERKTIREEIFHALRGLDALQRILDDHGITEVMINGPEQIFIERGGRIVPYGGHFSSAEKLQDVIQQIVARCNRVVNESSPVVDARLPDGARVNVVMAPVALNGPFVTIRRFPEEPITVGDLLAFGALSEEMAAFLRQLVTARYNLFVSGGTGSGKTTFLNALSSFIPHDERIITIEDNAELQIRQIANLVRMEARDKNVDGCKEISIRDLIKASLRMRPDRIIVGEVRGAEAIDMIQAMNTGHDGSMSTGHANSAMDMLRRLETMILMGIDLPLSAIRAQLSSGLDILIHLGRLRDGSRKVLGIFEVGDLVQGEYTLTPLYQFYETGEEDGKVKGHWIREGDLTALAKLEAAGL
ncbi:MAG: CpaF family protein [Lachnospiraceae bacterium]|nr:CpaF family protein [Lachnospiraceae bacterium]